MHRRPMPRAALAPATGVEACDDGMRTTGDPKTDGSMATARPDPGSGDDGTLGDAIGPNAGDPFTGVRRCASAEGVDGAPCGGGCGGRPDDLEVDDCFLRSSNAAR